MKTILKKAIVLCAVLFLSVVLFAQKSQVDLTTPLSVDPNVRIGKLDNGITYYIRKNVKPEKRVELRLAVNAGSILENDDQQGLAHFMEHMNFNGTKTFPHNELIDFLQKTGVSFGADINAYTGFDETVYMLQIPTDDTSLVEKGYQVMEDWAHNALLDDKEIDKERGVITEEWRLGLGAQDRMLKKIFPIIFKGSKYADRLPIGKEEIISNFKHQVLRDFYHDWYRPDLMSVIVVGDIDPSMAESRIIKHFSRITNPSPERERTFFDLPDNKDPLVAVATDKEASYNMVMMFYKHPLRSQKTLGDFRENLIAELYTGMLNNRLGEIAQKPESPFIGGDVSYGRFLARTKDSYMMNALSKENMIDKSLAVLLAENERVKRFGFTATEFERQKEDMISNYEKAAKEFDKTESADLAGNYVSNFLSGDPIPGAQKAFKYVKNLMPEITLEEINALAKKWMTEDNLAILVMAPEKQGLKVPTEQQLLDIVRSSKTEELKPYVDNFREEPLVKAEIKPGQIMMKQANSELGFTEMRLSNGVMVVVKPTNFKNDEILISAYSPGGNSLYPDKDFMSANYASQIVDMSGAGDFDNIQLEKKLKGKNLRINPYIDDVREGFRGNSTPKDFETLMQLVYLYFKSPRKDTTAYQAFMSQMDNQMKFMLNNPIMTFYDTLFKIAYPGYKRMIIFPSTAQLKEIDLDKAFSIYKDRFADAGDFRFFIVGNFNVDSISPLIEKYLGGLPNLNRNEKFKDTSPKFAEGETNAKVFKGTDPQSMVAIGTLENLEWNDKNLLCLKMVNEILDIKLVEVIREKMSGVYSPQVMLNWEKYPKPTCQLIVLFGCSPKNTEKLSKAVFGEIRKIRKSGPTDVDLKKAQEALIRKRETDIQKNDFWLNKIESIYYNGDNPANVMNYKDRVNAITAADVKEVVSKYIKADHYVRVVLFPEKK
jgi:zinc protease